MPYRDKEKRRKTYKRYAERNRDRLLENRRKRWEKLRNKAIDILGGQKCARCGCDDPRVLQIDHLGGGGRQEIKGIGPSGVIMKIIKTGGNGYQILCANCNWIKRHENKEMNQPDRKKTDIQEIVRKAEELREVLRALRTEKQLPLL